ncbi:MAG: hypothetical protein R6U50_00070 [Desulfobacterales bacterium]
MKTEENDQRWFRKYDEIPLYNRHQIINTLRWFLDYAGYKLVPEKPIGFMKPDIRAVRKNNKIKDEIIFVVREGVNDAVEGFRELAAAKCFRQNTIDYVLALPPVSEHYLIEFLIDKEEWFFPVKDHLFQLWLVNPEKEKVDCLIGWPRNEEFKHYFSNPNMVGFSGFIANKATKRLISDEFE